MMKINCNPPFCYFHKERLFINLQKQHNGRLQLEFSNPLKMALGRVVRVRVCLFVKKQGIKFKDLNPHMKLLILYSKTCKSLISNKKVKNFNYHPIWEK